MFRQTGPCQFDSDGIMTRGVIIRHLVLPGQVEAAKAVMDWVKDTFAPGAVLFSLMSQYTPWGRAPGVCGDQPPPAQGEVRRAEEYMALLGLEGFTQEREAASRQYIPPFDLTGV